MHCPEDLGHLVTQKSAGKLDVGKNEQVGRYLFATCDLIADEPVLTEEALFVGSDEARSLRKAVKSSDAQAMIDTWLQPDPNVDGGSNPLAHVDLFCNFALVQEQAKTKNQTSKRSARRDGIDSSWTNTSRERVRHLKEWFCRAEEQWVDRTAQANKLDMIHSALKQHVRGAVAIEDFQHLDDILNRNAEEFTGSVSIFSDCHGSQGSITDSRPSSLGPRRFQGIFPCKDLIQHSCVPNCMTAAGPDVTGSSPDGAERLLMHIVPLRSIRKGEPLTWNYLPYWKWLWPTQLRRRALHEGWNFICQCPRCEPQQRETSLDCRETVMAYNCPACGKGDLCPDRPCSIPSSSQGCCIASVGHVEALQAVECLRCSCGLQLHRNSPDAGPHPGYLERCLEQERLIFNLPWCGALGRNIDSEAAWLLSKDPDGVFLAGTHWLLADHASQLLENAPLIMVEQGLANEGANFALVVDMLNRLASAADSLLTALFRLAQHDRMVHAPELLQQKALCTGLQTDFNVYVEAHQRVFEGCESSTSSFASAKLLQKSRQHFLVEGLQMEPWTAERLRLQGSRKVASTPDVAGPNFEKERALVRQWLGTGLQTETDSDAMALWILRRMWLCPTFGMTERESSTDSEFETPVCAHKRPAAHQKRPASQTPKGSAKKKPARR